MQICVTQEIRNSNAVYFIHPHLFLVADNIFLSFEGLCAGVTGKKPLVTMYMLFMDLQVAAVSKGLQAGLTAINDICFHSVVHTGQMNSYSNIRRQMLS